MYNQVGGNIHSQLQKGMVESWSACRNAFGCRFSKWDKMRMITSLFCNICMLYNEFKLEVDLDVIVYACWYVSLLGLRRSLIEQFSSHCQLDIVKNVQYSLLYNDQES